jgi:uncharacterized protein YhjY with autotransporter beta-barrel domain
MVDWNALGAIGTLSAASVAVWLAGLEVTDRRQRRRDAERAQASRVICRLAENGGGSTSDVWFEVGYTAAGYTVDVWNGSDLPITLVTLTVTANGEQQTGAVAVQSADLGVLVAGAHLPKSFTFSARRKQQSDKGRVELQMGVSLNFTDSGGRVWTRDGITHALTLVSRPE